MSLLDLSEDEMEALFTEAVKKSGTKQLKTVFEAGRLAERQRILGLEVMRDEWEDPDIKGTPQTSGDKVVAPWRRNGLRAELRKAIGDSDE